MKPGQRQNSCFLRGDSAQAMVIGAISMFFILPAMALVYNVSQLVHQRIAVQQAADAAAYSGALVEANLLSTVAVANEAMAYTYYGLMRAATDVTATAVLAAIEDRGAPPDVVGVDHAGQRYEASYAHAQEWIPRGERWFDLLGKMEQGLAGATPFLLLQEIAESARASGAEAAAVFPKRRYAPEAGYHLLYFIAKLSNGWRITNNSGYLLEFLELGDRRWQVTASNVGTVLFEQLGDEHWRITSGHFEDDLFTDGVSYLKLDMTDRSTGEVTHVEAQQVSARLWEFILDSAQFGLHVLPYLDGTYLVEVKSPTVNYSEHVKWDTDNRLMVEHGGLWDYLPAQPTQVTVGGVVIDVHYVQRLTFPGGEFFPPDFVSFHEVVFRPPNRLVIPEVTIRIEPGSVTLYGQHELVRYRIRQTVFFDINGLTLKDADGRWRYLDEWTRHRLIEDSSVHWTYELQKEPSDLQGETPLRLGYHAVFDHDPDARGPGGFVLPEWTKWFRIDAGRSASLQAYHQTRPCWNSTSCDHVPFSPVSRNCGVCRGRDNDFDGITDFRVYQGDTVGWRQPDYQSVDVLSLPPPLRLSEAFWNFGIQVAAWSPGKKPMLGHRPSGHSLFPFFPHSRGLFAIASARNGFLYRGTKPAVGVPEPMMIYHFPNPQEARRWSLEGFQCLYEPIWSSKLVPMSEAARSEDIGAVPPDSATAFLFRAFESVSWQNVDPPDAFGHGAGAPRPDVRDAFKNLSSRWGKKLDKDDPSFTGFLLH
ncbi:MAG: hypothetical protein HYU36_25245 [Planctomycetes bacterium]|nr:hypothetical protein [Planctomycetota bacterium]